MTEMISVARFLTREEAEIARAALAEAGIEAAVFTDDAGGMVPALPTGVDLKVMASDAAAAEAIIKPADHADAEPADD